jgi:DNA topoisomerase-3
MRLIIAEKPSLARAIAAALPGPQRRASHHIECGRSDVVAWCAGHILSLAPPEEYAPELKAWTFDTLPIVPNPWRWRVTTAELFGALRDLVPKARSIVHAGDPDREGQLLVDEVLEFLGWQGSTERLLVTDLTPAAVERALGALEPNQRFRPLYQAALGRQRADWLYGLNLSRLCTLRARLAGYPGVVSVGRVQTPLLGLVVRRDREIEGFVSKTHYGVTATLRTADGASFPARWAVGKEHEAHTDEEGRLLSRAVAESVCRKVVGQSGIVAAHEEKRENDGPPLPFSLADLQIAASRRLGLHAAQVLEIAQRLYEQRLITYPRSDCSHLPEQQFGQATRVLRAIAATIPSLAEASPDTTRRSRAWNDAKVTAHHAIIPTETIPSAVLDGAERAVYELVARRYVQQFLPACEVLRTTIEIALGGERWVARSRQILALGWKALEQKEEPAEAKEGEGEDSPELPALRRGQPLLCASAAVVEKRTEPPKPFTDASLIQAMCNIAKYVTDDHARRILQETDGIGTPATRAAILETLLGRRFVERKKKHIRSTAVGRALIDALPAVTTTPDLTAMWETGLRRIQDGHLELDRFLAVVARQLGELVRRGKAQGPLPLPPPSTASARLSGSRGRASKKSRAPRRGRARSASSARRAEA